MLGLSLASRGARHRRRRRMCQLLRQRQLSTLWASTYRPERYEKSMCFRASTRKRNTKWFIVNISNQDDDNDNDNDWTKKLRLSPISRKKCDSNSSSPSPRWKSIVSMIVGRTSPITVVVNGKLYVMGGNFIRNPAKDIEIDRWAEVFDPHTKKWSFLPKPPDDLLPLGDSLVMCVGLEDLHKIMVTPYNSSKQAYLYDISQDIWTSKHHVNLCDHRFVSSVDNKDTAVFGNTL
ncbi:putative F-box/kelch-repeat protein [Camellia lanceoleosa]|nr:putative F-box/kelch-repeat protein [Camellia lanceoleosa]